MDICVKWHHLLESFSARFLIYSSVDFQSTKIFYINGLKKNSTSPTFGVFFSPLLTLSPAIPFLNQKLVKAVRLSYTIRRSPDDFVVTVQHYQCDYFIDHRRFGLFRTSALGQILRHGWRRLVEHIV